MVPRYSLSRLIRYGIYRYELQCSVLSTYPFLFSFSLFFYGLVFASIGVRVPLRLVWLTPFETIETATKAMKLWVFSTVYGQRERLHSSTGRVMLPAPVSYGSSLRISDTMLHRPPTTSGRCCNRHFLSSDFLLWSVKRVNLGFILLIIALCPSLSSARSPVICVSFFCNCNYGVVLPRVRRTSLCVIYHI